MKLLIQYLATYNIFLFAGTALRYFTQGMAEGAEHLSFFEIMQTVWIRYLFIAAILVAFNNFFGKKRKKKVEE